MWWFVLPAFAEPVCVAPVPERPRPGVRSTYDPDAPPRVLVPMRWHATGLVDRGAFHDDRGRRYPFREVERALLDNPHSQPAAAEYRRSLGPNGGVDGDEAQVAMDTPPAGMATSQWYDPSQAGSLDRQEPLLVRALCVFNTTQGPLLDQAAARERQLAEAARVRTAGDPSMAVWAIAATLYEAMGAGPPAAAAAWRADVVAVGEALAGGTEVETLVGRVRSGEGTLAERVQGAAVAPSTDAP